MKSLAACFLLILVTVAMADPIDDAEAKRRGVSVQQVQLEREQKLNADLQVKILNLQAQLQKIQSENDALKKQADIAGKPPPSPQPPPASQPTDKVVIPYSDFIKLPKGRIDNKPLGFTDFKMGSIGFVNTSSILRIVSPTSAIVDPGSVHADGSYNEGARRTYILVVGLSTSGLADDGAWDMNVWLKIVDTKQIGSTTYFVAEQIVPAPK